MSASKLLVFVLSATVSASVCAREPNPRTVPLAVINSVSFSPEYSTWDISTLDANYEWADGLYGFDGLLIELYCTVYGGDEPARLADLYFEGPSSAYWNENDGTHRARVQLRYRPAENTISMLLYDNLGAASVAAGTNEYQKCTASSCGFNQSPWISEWLLLPPEAQLDGSDAGKTSQELNIRWFMNSVNSFIVVKKTAKPLAPILQYQYLEFGYGATMDWILQQGRDFFLDTCPECYGLVLNTDFSDDAGNCQWVKGRPGSISLVGFQNNPFDMTSNPALRHWRNMNVRDQMRFASTQFFVGRPPLYDFPIGAAAVFDAMGF